MYFSCWDEKLGTQIPHSLFLYEIDENILTQQILDLTKIPLPETKKPYFFGPEIDENNLIFWSHPCIVDRDTQTL